MLKSWTWLSYWTTTFVDKRSEKLIHEYHTARNWMGQGLNLHLSDVSHCPEASSYPGLGYWSLFKSVERNEQFSWAVSLSLFKKTNQKSPRNGIEMMERVSHNRQLVDPLWTCHLQPHPLVLINEGTWVSFLQGTKRGKHLLCTAYWNLLWHNIPWAPITNFISK